MPNVLRNGMADQVRAEVDQRIALLLSGLDDAAEKIGESVNEITANVEREQRAIIRGSAVAGSFTATIDNIGGPPQGTAWLITQVSVFSSQRVWAAWLGLDDPTVAENSRIWGVPEIAPGVARSERTDIYIPSGREVYGQVGVTAVGDTASFVLHVKQLSLEP